MEATLSLQEDSSFPGQVKHMVVDFTYKSAVGAAAYTIARASSRLATLWVNKEIKLHKVAWENAYPVLTPIQAQPLASAPPVEPLKAVPGCYEAFMGLSILPGARI